MMDPSTLLNSAYRRDTAYGVSAENPEFSFNYSARDRSVDQTIQQLFNKFATTQKSLNYFNSNSNGFSEILERLSSSDLKEFLLLLKKYNVDNFNKGLFRLNKINLVNEIDIRQNENDSEGFFELNDRFTQFKLERLRSSCRQRQNNNALSSENYSEMLNRINFRQLEELRIEDSRIWNNEKKSFQYFNQEAEDRQLRPLSSPLFAQLRPVYESDLRVKARKAALSSETQFALFTEQLVGNPVPYIEGLRAFFKKMALDALKEFYMPALTDIQKLHEACSRHFTPHTLDFSGQDSLNRELLVSSEWNSALSCPHVILGLFALEAASQYMVTAPKDTQRHIQYNVLFSTPTGTRTITGMMEFGFRYQPLALLEVLPLNKSVGADKDSAHVKEYLRRKEIYRTFVPILRAIRGAYTQVLQEVPVVVPEKSPLERPYDAMQWKMYIKYFTAILDYIEDKSETELFALEASHYTPQDLKSQTMGGFELLLSKMGTSAEKETFESLVEKISTSDILLDQHVSHLFYDRLHLLVALKSTLFIQLKGGERCTLRKLLSAIVHSFVENGVTTANSIAAEQLYFRILFLSEKLGVTKYVVDVQVLTEQYEEELFRNPSNVKLRSDLAKLYKESGNYLAARSLVSVDAAVSFQADMNRQAERINAYLRTIGVLSEGVFKKYEEERVLLPVEAHLIHYYTRSYYKIVNAYLRKDMATLQTNLDSFPFMHEPKRRVEAVAFVREVAPIITRAIEKLPTLMQLYPGNANIGLRFVYRGMTLPPHKIHEWQRLAKEKKPITSPAFTSTSTSAEQALSSAFIARTGEVEPVFCIIEGKSAVFIQQYSMSPDEKEVLFHPHVKFVILEIKEMRKTDAQAKDIQFPRHLDRMWVVKMKEEIL